MSIHAGDRRDSILLHMRDRVFAVGGYALALLLGLGCPSVEGQQPHFQRAPGNEVLEARVLCITEDSIGGIWVGTTNGLARILGDHVRVWEQGPGDTLSIQANEVRSIDASDPLRVWVGTSRGLCSVDPVSGQVVRYPFKLRDPGSSAMLQVWHVVRGDDDIIWISSSMGLVCYDRKRASWFRPAIEQSRYPGEPFMIVPNAMVWDKGSKVVWVGTKDGLYRIQGHMLGPGGRPFVLDPFMVPTNVTCLTVDQHGTLWMNDPQRYEVLSLAPSTGCMSSMPLPAGSSTSSLHRSIMVDPEQNIWLAGNDDRLYRQVPGSGWTVVAHDPTVAWSLPNTSVNALLAARNGVLWFGTDEGLFRCVPLPWGQELLLNWVSPSTVNRLNEHGTDHLIATNGSGIVRYDALKRQIKDTICHGSPRTLDGLVGPAVMEDMVTDLLPVGGEVLIATKAGLFSWSAGASLPDLVVDLIPIDTKLHGKWIDRVVPGSNGVVWVLLRNHGLWKLLRDQAPVQILSKVMPEIGDIGRPSALAPHPDGGVWCGTSLGFLVRTDPSGRIVKRVWARSGARSAGFMEMVSTDAGTMWAGFDDGTLGLFDAACQEAGSFEKKDGLPGGPVVSLALEGEDRLWVLSENGLAHLDAHRSPNVEPVALSPQWGRPTTMMPLKNGGAILAFTRTLVKVVEGDVVGPGSAVTPLLTVIRQDGKPLLGGVSKAELALRYDQRTIRVEFSAVGAVFPEELRFRYRTAPDRPWVPLEAARSLDLYDIAEGYHRIAFAVAGTGEPARIAELVLVVTPPWYRTRAALLLWSLLIVLLLVWMIRTFLRRKLDEEKARSQSERALLEERIRIAHDLHDDLGSSLALIAMEGELARMGDSGRAHDALKRVSEGAREVTDNMRRIVWALGSGQDTLGDLAAYIRSSAADLMERADLELTTEISITTPGAKLSTDQRRHLLLMTKELLLNVVKHAQAQRTTMLMAQENGSLRLVITDNGVGFDTSERIGTGTGTTSVFERVKALNGTVDLHSAIGQGTRVTIVVPLTMV